MSELNPNHPVTQAMRDQWHKVLGMAMHKLGVTHLVITAEDIQNMPQGNFIVAQELNDGLHIYFVDQSTAQHEISGVVSQYNVTQWEIKFMRDLQEKKLKFGSDAQNKVLADIETKVFGEPQE